MTRIYPWLVVVFWAASMAWLLGAKVLPPLFGGNPPDFTPVVTGDAEGAKRVAWRIAWNERRIGTASSQIYQRDPSTIVHRHVVHFQRLPIQAMLSESFGLFGAVLKPLFGNDSNLELDVLLATELRFNAEHQFTDFQSVLQFGEMRDVIRVHGVLDSSQTLRLTTTLPVADPGKPPQMLRHEVHLPRESLIGDAFAPRSDLKNVQVGQRWTVPIYRPLPGNNAIQILEAVAERLDVIVWDAKDVETVLVVFREDAGSGLHTSRDPIAREWIRADGTVLQREVRLSNLRIVFERLTPHSLEPELDMLDSRQYPHLWSEE